MLKLCIRAASGSSQTSRGTSCASESAATCATPPPPPHFTFTTASCSPFHSTLLHHTHPPLCRHLFRAASSCPSGPEQVSPQMLSIFITASRAPLCSLRPRAVAPVALNWGKHLLFCKLLRRGRIDKVSAEGGKAASQPQAVS